MRKLLSALFALILAVSLSLSALADVIWEPYNDSYYNKHKDDFVFSRAAYEAPEDVPCYDKPDGKVIDTISKGDTFWSEYVCTAKGTSYLVADWWVNGEWVSVYVPKDQMQDRYDDEFFTDFKDEISSTPPEEIPELFWEDSFRYWVYPGGPSWESANYASGEDFVNACQSFYTDPQGNIWGYIGYWYGHQNSWICLNAMNEENLTGPEIPQRPAPTEPTAPAQAPTVEHPAVKTQSALWLFPAAVVVCSTILLLGFPRRKK